MDRRSKPRTASRIGWGFDFTMAGSLSRDSGDVNLRQDGLGAGYDGAVDHLSIQGNRFAFRIGRGFYDLLCPCDFFPGWTEAFIDDRNLAGVDAEFAAEAEAAGAPGI